MSKKLLVVAIVCFMVGTGCTSPGARLVPHQNLQAPNAWPKLLAVYMPWFGNRVHMDVGYVSYDPNVLRHQIEQALLCDERLQVEFRQLERRHPRAE